MTNIEAIERLEKEFIDYSDKAHQLVFFIRDGLTKNMQIDDLIEMKNGLLNDLNEAMFTDQEYMYLLGQANPHPNFEKCLTYMKIAKVLLDKEIVEKDLKLEGEMGF